jgi:hypothetical protein
MHVFQYSASASEITAQEIEALNHLRNLIYEALEDGKITKLELNAIRTAALADGKLSQAECELYSSLILEKVKTGEVQMEW